MKMATSGRELGYRAANILALRGNPLWVVAFSLFFCTLDVRAANEDCLGKLYYIFEFGVFDFYDVIVLDPLVRESRHLSVYFPVRQSDSSSLILL